MATFLRSAAAGEVFRTAERQNAKKSRIQVSGTVNEILTGYLNPSERSELCLLPQPFLARKFKYSTIFSKTDYFLTIFGAKIQIVNLHIKGFLSILVAKIMIKSEVRSSLRSPTYSLFISLLT